MTELSWAWEELEDFELQAVTKGMEAANRLTEGAKVELDRERIAFEDKKDDLLCELEQALAD